MVIPPHHMATMAIQVAIQVTIQVIPAAAVTVPPITAIHPLYAINSRIELMFLFSQRALTVLCILLLSSCTPACRKWEIQEIMTTRPCFNAGRLILGPSSGTSNLELELVHNQTGIRFYINLLFLQAQPSKDNPSLTKVEITFENDEVWIISPYLLEGGQRLLLAEDDAERLIQSLIEGCTFTIRIGRSQITVIPDNFLNSYEKLTTKVYAN